MGTLRVYLLQDGGTFPFGNFLEPTLVSNNGEAVKYVESDGDYLVLKGKNLTVEGGVLVDGTITSMTHYNVQGVKYCSLTDFKFDAEDLPLADNSFAFSAAMSMMKGKDTVLGTNTADGMGGWNGRDMLKGLGGDDILWGHKGNDRLSGGGGADDFYITTGDGHDTITDFNSRGDDVSTHDQIRSSAGYTVHQQGKNTLIEFDNDTSVTLLDFKKAQLDEGDILVL